MNQADIDAANQQEIDGLRGNRAELIKENDTLKKEVATLKGNIKKIKEGIQSAIYGMKAIEIDTDR